MINNLPARLLIVPACIFLFSCEKKQPTPISSSEKYSSVETQSQFNHDGLLDVNFKVKLTNNMQYTFDAPWSLELIEHEGLTFTQSSFPSSSLNKETAGFSATTLNKPQAASGKIKYKLISFICTEDKKQCFREVHENESEWVNPNAKEKISAP